MSWIKSKVDTAFRRNDDSAKFDRVGQVEMFDIMQGAAYGWEGENMTEPPKLEAQGPEEIIYGIDLKRLFMEPKLFRFDLLSQLDKDCNGPVGLERIFKEKMFFNFDIATASRSGLWMLFHDRKQACVDIDDDRMFHGLDILFAEPADYADETEDDTKYADDTEEDSLLLFAYRFH